MRLPGLVGSLWLALVCAMAGCGDGNTAGEGGGGGQGGSGGGSSAVPKAAWAVAFEDAGPDCQVGSENRQVGQITSDAVTSLVTDGESEATVSCTVADTGSGFQVSALASQQGVALTFLIGSLPATATKDAPATGSVSYASPNTGSAFTSADCDFYFTAGTPQGVKEGEVWLTFECPQIAAAVDNVCAIGIGYAAFEGCSTTAE